MILNQRVRLAGNKQERIIQALDMAGWHSDRQINLLDIERYYTDNGIELYHQNYYVSVKEKNRTYHEVYALPVSDAVPEGYNEVSLVCLRQDGAYEAPSTVSCMCRAMKKRIDGFENFHFHLFRHTYTSKLLANGAAPKDVQELLGHNDINTTLNVYAHATRESKRSSAMLLDATASAV